MNGCTRVHQDFAGTVHTCTFTLQVIHALASVNSLGDKYGSVKFERLTGIEAPAETPCQS